MKTRNHVIYVLSEDGAILPGVRTYAYLNLKAAKKAVDRLPKTIKGRVNIHIFRSCGIAEHGADFD